MKSVVSLCHVELHEIAKEWSERTKQVITDEMVDEFCLTGLNNVDFLTSDYLNKYGLLNLFQYLKTKSKTK